MATCKCVTIGNDSLSLFADRQPLQTITAYSDSDCQEKLGQIEKQKCIDTKNFFEEGTINSVYFDLSLGCKIKGVADHFIDSAVEFWR